MNRNTIVCPHCDGRVRTQTSRQLSPLVREIYFECVSVDCGHRFVAQLGIVRTLVPSLTPRDSISLPIVQRRPHNDILLPPPALAAPIAIPRTPQRVPAMILN